MLVFITTDNGTGWISRGGDHLVALKEFAAKFVNHVQVRAAVANLRRLADTNSVGWEGSVIEQIEVLPDNTPERNCVEWVRKS